MHAYLLNYVCAHVNNKMSQGSGKLVSDKLLYGQLCRVCETAE